MAKKKKTKIGSTISKVTGAVKDAVNKKVSNALSFITKAATEGTSLTGSATSLKDKVINTPTLFQNNQKKGQEQSRNALDFTSPEAKAQAQAIQSNPTYQAQVARESNARTQQKAAESRMIANYVQKTGGSNGKIGKSGASTNISDYNNMSYNTKPVAKAVTNTAKPRNMSLATGGFVDSTGNRVMGSPDVLEDGVTTFDDGSTSFSPTEVPLNTSSTPLKTSTASPTATSTVSAQSFSNPYLGLGATKTMSDFNLRLKDVTNDSWTSPGTKVDLTKGVYESTANELSKGFDDIQGFNLAYNSNPAFKNSIDTFVSRGGDVNAITSRIQPSVKENVQSLQEYLSVDLSKATPQEMLAYETLIPEQRIAQEEIANLAGLSKETKDLYFGTPEEVGIQEQKRIQAEEKIKIIERKKRNDERDLKAMAQYEIDKNDAELELESAKVEENRLAAKNYMTGMLAKLGALNTTGAAPLALQTLETKYQQQSSALRIQTEFSNRQIQMKLSDGVNDMESERDENILKVQSDLSKDKEEIYKEIMKIEQSSRKEILKITGGYAKDLRTQTDKYRKEANAEAKKYLSTQESLMRKFNPKALLSRYGVTNAKGSGSSGSGGSTSKLNMDTNTYKYFMSLPKGFRDKYTQTFIERADSGQGVRPTVSSLKYLYQDPRYNSSLNKKTSTTSKASSPKTTSVTDL